MFNLWVGRVALNIGFGVKPRWPRARTRSIFLFFSEKGAGEKVVRPQLPRITVIASRNKRAPGLPVNISTERIKSGYDEDSRRTKRTMYQTP